MDEFDLALLEGVENGFFDPELIEKHAAKLDKAFKVQAREGSYKDAWSTYHGSFDCNDKEVTDTLYASFKKNIQIIAPINLSGTVRLFKGLGRSDEAEELVQLYVMEREEDREFWDLANHVFPGDKVDPDVETAFEKKLESLIAKFDPVAVLLKIAEQDSWHTRDVQKLASLSSDDYYNIFKSRSGSDLTSVVKAALQFGRIGNATPPMQEIFNRAREALARIGKECPINARRVRKYGIEVAEGDVAPGIAAAPDPAEG